MMIPAPLAAILLPILKRQGANYAASFLNERRQKRRLSKRALEVRESLDPEILAELCPPSKADPAPPPTTRNLLPALVSGLLGVVVGAAASAFFQRAVRSRRRSYANR